MDIRKYRTGAEIAVIIALMISLGVNVVDGDEGYLPYSCDSNTIDDMMCYKLSRVGVTGVNRNCYYDRDRPAKYKVCSTGWEKIINVDEYGCDRLLVVAYTDNGKYYCDGVGGDANCVNSDFEQVPLSMLE